jgi:peptidyl-tRNA hydrolase
MMRNDLVDLNPGKAMAQAAHAANQFTNYYDKNVVRIFTQEMDGAYREWQNQAQGFGTTIVLSATKFQIQQIIPLAISEGYLADFTFDTSYPIKDGTDTITVNAMTCAYVFVAPYTDEYETEIQLRRLSLHP